MSHLALARKWRPKKFTDVVGQPFVVQALTNALNKDLLHHAYLFTGTRGVGKTTIARIFAKCLNCETGVTATPCNQCAACTDIDAGRFPDLFEIDAASRTKVEDTREILDNVPYAPTVGRYKIYLIDEVHMLSGHSFNALLKTLEEPPAHIKFLLATTDPQKLPATVLSRCLQFHLSHVAIDDINTQLEKILTAESVPFESDATALISKAASGSLRDALSLLDQSIAFGNGTITTQHTRQLLGTIDHSLLLDLISALAESNADKLITLTATLNTQGVNFSRALAELLSHLHTITLLQLTTSHLADDRLVTIAKKLAPETIQLYYQIGLIGQRDLAFAPTPQSGFEMTLLRMLAFTPAPNAGTTQQPAAPRKAASPTADTKQPTVSPSNWQDLYNKLQLTGAARMLAEQCSTRTLTDQKIELALDPKHKALMQDAMVQRLKKAITSHLGHAIDFSITLSGATTDTPANAKLRADEATQKNAENAIYSDSKVQQIINAFDAKIIKESIKPITQNSGEEE
ncbi:MAG: DNA polymerase III subunit gamma/tau [Coxiella sp. (in: Bacteria)]|nr:MAG: DNA polymerase III subunit gamma/tau [Coxiella sp. (in: g-proteobacteria)]